MKANHILILAGMSLAAITGLAIALTPEHDNTQPEKRAPVFNPNPVIHEYALDGLPFTEYPQLAALIGKQGMKIAREAVKAAAYRAAKTPDCDAVENANVSQTASSRESRFYFVNCDNGRQFRDIGESELRDEQGRWYTLESAPPFGY